MVAIGRCVICGVEIDQAYLSMNWTEQRRFHRFYCIRCKSCIPENKAHPYREGWCVDHWKSRYVKHTNSDPLMPAKGSKAKNIAGYKGVEYVARLNQINHAGRAVVKVTSIQHILDRASDRDRISKVEMDEALQACPSNAYSPEELCMHGDARHVDVQDASGHVVDTQCPSCIAGHRVD